MKVQAEHEGHARLRTIILKTISGMRDYIDLSILGQPSTIILKTSSGMKIRSLWACSLRQGYNIFRNHQWDERLLTQKDGSGSSGVQYFYKPDMG